MRAIFKLFVIAVFAIGTTAQSHAQTTSDKDAVKIDTLHLDISGMSCQKGCADGLDATFIKTKGVTYSKTSYPSSLAVIAYNPNLITYQQLLKIVEKRGFKAKVHPASKK